MTGGAADARPSSMWPATAGCALVGAAIVVALLAPLDPSSRNWIVRGLLAFLAVGLVAVVVARERIDPRRIDRPARVAFQTAFFWASFTGLTFAMHPLGFGMEPLSAVRSGAIAALLFAPVTWALDRWVVHRHLPRRS